MSHATPAEEKMRLLSIDVGLKNLALCVLETGEADAPAGIVDWRVLDLVSDAPVFCKAVLQKKGTECGQRACFQGDLNGETHYYCGTHRALHTRLLEEPIPEITGEGSRCSKGKCRGRVEHRLDGAPLCPKHIQSVLKQLRARHAVTKVRGAKCRDVDPTELRIKMWRVLDALGHLLRADAVIIENQPSLKNPIMKSIAETLYNYFICRGLVDKELTGSTIRSIRYVSPSNKMKLSAEMSSSLGAIKNKALKYRKTKELSIQHARQLLSADEGGQRFLMQHTKRDDLADSLLQGIAHLAITGTPATSVRLTMTWPANSQSSSSDPCMASISSGQDPVDCPHASSEG